MSGTAFEDAVGVVAKVLMEEEGNPNVYKDGSVPGTTLKSALAKTISYLVQKVKNPLDLPEVRAEILRQCDSEVTRRTKALQEHVAELERELEHAQARVQREGDEEHQQQQPQQRELEAELEGERENSRVLKEEIVRLKKKVPKEVARFPPPPVVDKAKTAEEAADALVRAAAIMGPALENIAKTHVTEAPEDAPNVIRKVFNDIELEPIADWKEVDEEVLWQRQKRFTGPRQAVCFAFREGRCAPAQWRTCGRAHLPHCYDPRCVVDLEQRRKCKHVWHSREEGEPEFASSNKHVHKAKNQGNASRPSSKKPSSNADKGSNGSSKRNGPPPSTMGNAATFKKGKVPPARGKGAPKPAGKPSESFPKLQSKLEIAEAKLAVYEKASNSGSSSNNGDSSSVDQEDMKLFLKFKKFLEFQKA